MIIFLSFVIVMCFAESAIAVYLLSFGCVAMCFSCCKKDESSNSLQGVEVQNNAEKEETNPPSYGKEQF